MPMKDRYEHSIFDVCEALHDEMSGTGDGLPDERRELLIDWLRRRLDAWQNTPQSFHASSCDYDHAVRLLAKATLEMHDWKRREFGM